MKLTQVDYKLCDYMSLRVNSHCQFTPCIQIFHIYYTHLLTYLLVMPTNAVRSNETIYKYASYLDWHISPHADRRSPRNTNSLQHWPSPTIWWPVSHTTHDPPLSSQVCCTRLTTVKRLI